MSSLFLIVGLGNPGTDYPGTRHNIGFAAIDALADRLNARWGREKDRGLQASGQWSERRVLLLKPQTYMNLSGEAVWPVCQFFKLPPDQLVVLHDDLDLELGRVQVRLAGGDGGHRGVRSIQEALGTDGFLRCRLGVGRPPPGVDPVDYVLTRFRSEEQPAGQALVERAVQLVEVLVKQGLTVAMNRFNPWRKPKPPKPEGEPTEDPEGKSILPDSCGEVPR